MAYFDNDNDEYGWEDELARAHPPAEDGWVQINQFAHISRANDLFRAIYEEGIAEMLNDTTNVGTYAGVTRSETPTWRTLVR
jgi:hypothetical protein